MNPKLKNTLILVLTPIAISAVYFSSVAVFKAYKRKQIMDFISNHYNKTKDPNQPSNIIDVLIGQWKKELDKLNEFALNAFYNYLMITIPNGKDEKGEKWNYEISNPEDYIKKKSTLDKYNEELSKNSKVMEFFNNLNLKN